MPGKTGASRIQYGLFATPLEELIAPDNMVQVMDAFVDTLDLAETGFKTSGSLLVISDFLWSCGSLLYQLPSKTFSADIRVPGYNRLHPIQYAQTCGYS